MYGGVWSFTGIANERADSVDYLKEVAGAGAQATKEIHAVARDLEYLDLDSSTLRQDIADVIGKVDSLMYFRVCRTFAQAVNALLTEENRFDLERLGVASKAVFDLFGENEKHWLGKVTKDGFTKSTHDALGKKWFIQQDKETEQALREQRRKLWVLARHKGVHHLPDFLWTVRDEDDQPSAKIIYVMTVRIDRRFAGVLFLARTWEGPPITEEEYQTRKKADLLVFPTPEMLENLLQLHPKPVDSGDSGIRKTKDRELGTEKERLNACDELTKCLIALVEENPVWNLNLYHNQWVYMITGKLRKLVYPNVKTEQERQEQQRVYEVEREIDSLINQYAVQGELLPPEMLVKKWDTQGVLAYWHSVGQAAPETVPFSEPHFRKELELCSVLAARWNELPVEVRVQLAHGEKIHCSVSPQFQELLKRWVAFPIVIFCHVEKKGKYQEIRLYQKAVFKNRVEREIIGWVFLRWEYPEWLDWEEWFSRFRMSAKTLDELDTCHAYLDQLQALPLSEDIPFATIFPFSSPAEPAITNVDVTAQEITAVPKKTQVGHSTKKRERISEARREEFRQELMALAGREFLTDAKEEMRQILEKISQEVESIQPVRNLSPDFAVNLGKCCVAMESFPLLPFVQGAVRNFVNANLRDSQTQIRRDTEINSTITTSEGRPAYEFYWTQDHTSDRIRFPLTRLLSRGQTNSR